MDIQIEKPKTSTIRKYWYVFLVIPAIILIFWFRHVFGDVSYIADRNQIRIAQVKKGDFYIDVRSNGQLSPREYHRIPAEVSGHVEQLLVRVGDSVEEGSPLAVLRNIDLLKEVDRAEWEYKQVQAESNATIKSLESQLLQLEAEALRAELAFESNSLKMKAEQKLIKDGFGIVSEIDHKRSVFAVQEQEQLWKFFKKRMGKMKENLVAQKAAADARIARRKSDLEKAQREIELLTVRSRSKGLVQEFDLEPGQKLNIGDPIATIADTTELIAELKVQELQVQRVQVGQDVLIDTRKNLVKGKVIRIHPSVDSGMVQVDVDFVEPQTPEMRIALSVEGEIRTFYVPDTTFVQRPAYAQPGEIASLYKLDEGNSRAARIPVQLGLSSVNNVQVLDGLREGDRVIVSDISGYAEHQNILIR